MTTTGSISAAEFRRTCREVCLWAQRLRSEGAPFFDSRTRPATTISAILHDCWERGDHSYECPDLRDRISQSCQETVDRRRAALAAQASDAPPVEGRLLLYDPRITLHEGLATDSGVFDENDAPCWEFWVTVIAARPAVRDGGWAQDWALVAWVPPPCLDAAKYGVSVMPTEASSWAGAASGSGAASVLRRMGVLDRRQ